MVDFAISTHKHISKCKTKLVSSCIYDQQLHNWESNLVWKGNIKDMEQLCVLKMKCRICVYAYIKRHQPGIWWFYFYPNHSFTYWNFCKSIKTGAPCHKSWLFVQFMTLNITWHLITRNIYYNISKGTWLFISAG